MQRESEARAAKSNCSSFARLGVKGPGGSAAGDGRHPPKLKLQVFKHFIQNSSSSSGGNGEVNEELLPHLDFLTPDCLAEHFRVHYLAP